ncbi:hypothetical protein H5410_005267 [Solanum commersonii]|uniref:Uncharacterized protein n=1 Tax=Solanum commersonii TaxID=4109 RepID=A0A9J6A678_SOLCO|nr:hypothetical protein H5410_005267 [Solanum commersonii]
MCNLCTGTKEPSCKLPMTTLYQLKVSLPEKSLHDSSNIKQKRCKFCNNSLIFYRHPRLLASAIAKDEVLRHLYDTVLFKVNVGSRRLY